MFVSLKRVLSWPQLLALGAAGIIGTSWAYMNTRFYSIYGPGGVILGYAIGTLMAFLVALAYAEMGSTIPKAGGEVAFVFPTLGPLGSFFVGWMFILSSVLAGAAFYVIGISLLLSWWLPSLYTIPIYSIAGVPVYLPALLLGITCAILILILNYRSVSLTGQAQLIMFIMLLLAGATILITALFKGSISNFANPSPFPQGENPLGLGLRFGLISIGYLSGFEGLPALAEEIKIKPRTFGLVITGSVLVAGAFYMTMMFAGSLFVPWQQSYAIAHRGTIELMSRYSIWLGLIAWLASFLGLVTSWIPSVMTTSRMVFALAREGLFPSQFERIHPKYGTPTIALIFITIISIIFGSLGEQGLIWFLDIGGVGLGTCWLLSTLSMILTRRKYPNIPRYFKVPAGYLVGILGSGITLTVILVSIIPGTSLSIVWPYEYMILILWIVLGLIIYPFAKRRMNKLGFETVARNLLGEYYDVIYGKKEAKTETK
jgi:amino acid transporter